jgi:HSP20 family protein
MADNPTKSPVPVEKKISEPTAMRGGWPSIESLRREMDHLFDSFYKGWPFGPARAGMEPFLGRGTSVLVAPAIDVAETEKGYELSAELPGMDEKDIEIKLANGMLTIGGEKKESREEKDKGYHLSERRYGYFQRAFQVPDGVDVDKIEANFAKGVLTVKLPKSAEAQKAAKRIAVKAA